MKTSKFFLYGIRAMAATRTQLLLTLIFFVTYHLHKALLPFPSSFLQYFLTSTAIRFSWFISNFSQWICLRLLRTMPLPLKLYRISDQWAQDANFKASMPLIAWMKKTTIGSDHRSWEYSWKGKEKTSHYDRTDSAKNDPRFQAWDEKDSMIVS